MAKIIVKASTTSPALARKTADMSPTTSAFSTMAQLLRGWGASSSADRSELVL
jgi:hypothetical protein